MSATKKTSGKKSEEIGFGVVGLGNIGPWHRDAIQKATGARLVAVCDINEPRAKQVAAESGKGIRAYKSISDMLHDDEVQAVSICTPSGMHAMHAIQCMDAGRHILCEKPMDIELCKIDAMIEASKRNNVKLAGIFQRRTWASSNKAREAVRTGKLGKLVVGDCYQKYFRSHEYYASGAWRATWELDGGGCLMNQGVHGIDLLLYVMGDVKRVSAFARRLTRNIAVEDTAVAIVEFVNGAVGVIEGTTSVTPGYGCDLEVHGELGSIKLSEDNITAWDIPGDEATEASEGEGGAGTAADPLAGLSIYGHIQHVTDLAAAIRENREPMIPGSEARRAVEVIKAIYKSSREGGAPIELPLSYEDDGPGIEPSMNQRYMDW